MIRPLRLYRPDRLPPRHRANVPPAGQEMPAWLPWLLLACAAVAGWTLLRALDHALYIGAAVVRP